ncbi:MAG: bifunctional UDP-sugar hydrolase/5'-nucleotidase [Bacilli bacterium]
MKKKIAFLLAVSFLAVGCKKTDTTSSTSAAPVSSSTKTEPKLDKDLAILYTNDVHCQVGDAKTAGYSELASYKKKLLSENKYVTLVDCGDAIQGGAIGTLSKGSYIVDIMNKVGYDVAIPGNHEFDYGAQNFVTLSEKANYEYVSANFMDLSTNKTVFKPYTIKDYNGVKIAYVGITTPNTITSSAPKYFQDDNGNYLYGFCQDKTGEKLFKAVQDAVDSAKAEGANYVVGLGHLGTTEDCSPYMSSEVVSKTNGIDVMLDGHSHSIVESKRVKNKDGKYIPISSTGTKFESFGMLYLTKEGSLSSGLISDYATKDEETTNYIATINEKFADKLAEKIGTSTVDLNISNSEGTRIVRNHETNLGDLCADSYRASAEGTDIGIINGGGVRVAVKKGDITYGQIISVMPFNNMLCQVELTGKQIVTALEWGARKAPEENGGFLQVSGLSYEIDSTIPTPCVADANGIFESIGETHRVKNVKVGTADIDLTKTYKVVGTTYTITNMGDGFSMFKGCNVLLNEYMVDNQALIDFVKKNLSGTIPESYKDPAGRITVNY